MAKEILKDSDGMLAACARMSEDSGYDAEKRCFPVGGLRG